MAFGAIIKEAREALPQPQNNQRGFATRIGVDPSLLCKWEKEQAFPGSALLTLLARNLNLNGNDLARVMEQDRLQRKQHRAISQNAMYGSVTNISHLNSFASGSKKLHNTQATDEGVNVDTSMSTSSLETQIEEKLRAVLPHPHLAQQAMEILTTLAEIAKSENQKNP